jgi:N,N-dimethylformamidase
LVLDEGKPTFVWGENGTARKLALDKAVAAYQWCRLTVRICATDRLIHLEQDPVDNIMNRCSLRAIGSSPEKSSAKVHEKFCPGEAPFRIGALAWHDGERWLALNAYNGKIGGLRIRRVIPTTNEFNELASWHFAQSNREDGLLLQDVIDQSGNGLHGRCYNTPTRGVTGHLFLGLNDDFRLAPDEYDAIHFHDDDITDAQWPASFDFKIPVEFSSGVYAVKLTDDNSEYYIPFFVRAGKIKRNVAVLFSTATYLAYANDRIAFEANGAEIIVSRTPIIDRADLTLQEHPEFGRSCYEIHGSFEFQVG